MKMIRPPTFLHMLNLKAGDRQFILHTKHPSYLAEVFNESPVELDVVAKEEFNSKTYYFSIVKMYEEVENEEKLSRIISRMADWYKFNYLKNENP